jgi:Secretion system C-terminal sorting domain
VWCGVNQIPSGIDKIIMTTNGGMNWIITEIEAGMKGPQNIRFSEDNQTGLFVGLTGSTGSFFRTTNGGYNWSVVYTPTDDHYSRAMRWVLGTSNIYECSEYQLVRSTNSGINWTVMTGTPPNSMTALDAVRINEGTIYALMITLDRRVYKLLDTVRTIGIEITGTSIPKVYALYQNYPNPFNPTTTIKFDIPKDGNVTIKIYDVLGKAAAILANNEFKKAGEYQVIWDASEFSSGLYFYRLESGNFVETKRMVLVK